MGLKPDNEKMEAETDVKKLMRSLKYHENDDVQYRAAEAIQRIEESALEPLNQALKEENSDVRKKC